MDRKWGRAILFWVYATFLFGLGWTCLKELINQTHGVPILMYSVFAFFFFFSGFYIILKTE